MFPTPKLMIMIMNTIYGTLNIVGIVCIHVHVYIQVLSQQNHKVNYNNYIHVLNLLNRQTFIYFLRMVLGLIAAAGVGLAGYGIFKGSTDAGKAAKRAGRGAEMTLQAVSQEVKQMREFLTEKAWPDVNRTLVHFREVLDHANVFLDTSTFTVKVLALLLFLCAAFVTHKLASGRNPASRWQLRGRNHNSVAKTIENTVLEVIYCLCLVSSLVLILQLLKELVNITQLNQFPIVVLIPSLTTLAILYQHLKAFFALLRYIPYLVIELPIAKGMDPVTKGSGYMSTIVPLQLLMCIIYLILYSFIPLGAYWILDYLRQSEKSTLKCILLAYCVFYATTIVLSLAGAFIISQLIRPVWAIQARRNLRRNH